MIVYSRCYQAENSKRDIKTAAQGLDGFLLLETRASDPAFEKAWIRIQTLEIVGNYYYVGTGSVFYLVYGMIRIRILSFPQDPKPRYEPL